MLFKGPDLIEIFKLSLDRQQNYLSHMYVCRHNLGILQAIASFLQNSEGIQRMRNIRLARKRETAKLSCGILAFFFSELILSKFSGMSNEKCSKLCSFFDVGSTEGRDKVTLRNASRLQSRKSFRVLDFLLLVS